MIQFDQLKPGTIIRNINTKNMYTIQHIYQGVENGRAFHFCDMYPTRTPGKHNRTLYQCHAHRWVVDSK